MYAHYDALFLHSNATFLCERAHAELRTQESLEALASCYLRQGQPKRAYSVLAGVATRPHGRYLLAVACIRLEKPHEAEEALLPDKKTRAPSDDIIHVVPNRAAGLYVLGLACQRTHRREQAIEYYKLSLKCDNLMWIAFEALCALGAEVVDYPGDGAPLPSRPAATPARARLFPVEDSAGRAAFFEHEAAASPTPRTTAKVLAFASAADTVEKPPSKMARRDDEPAAAAPAVMDASSSSEEAEPLRRSLLAVLQQLGAARAAVARNDSERALKALHAVPPRHFETGWVLHTLGRVHFERADYEAAREAFRRMERAEPHRMAGLELLSTALWHLKYHVELCTLARRCVHFEPRGPEAWCCAGNCLSQQKEHDAAVRCFQRAIAVDPRFAYAYTLCGHEYVANEDFDKAVAMYRHAMRIDDRHYNAWYGLGAIFYRQEKYEHAQYHFERALGLNPQSSVLETFLGMTLHANKKCDEALAHLRKATAMDPKNPQARFQCANVLISMDRYDKALDELKAVADHAPKEPSVHFLMGKVCKKLGKLQDAMMHFTFALDLEPKDNNLIKSAIDRLEEPDIDEDEKF